MWSGENLIYRGEEYRRAYMGDELVWEGRIEQYNSMKIRNGLNEVVNMTITNYGGNTPNFLYSFDGRTWATWDYEPIAIPAKTVMQLRGYNPNGVGKHISEWTAPSVYSNIKFDAEASCEIYGDVWALIDGGEGDHAGYGEFFPNAGFYNLFNDSNGYTWLDELRLPADAGAYSFTGAFSGLFVVDSDTFDFAVTGIRNMTGFYCYQGCFSGNYLHYENKKLLLNVGYVGYHACNAIFNRTNIGEIEIICNDSDMDAFKNAFLLSQAKIVKIRQTLPVSGSKANRKLDSAFLLMPNIEEATIDMKIDADANIGGNIFNSAKTGGTLYVREDSGYDWTDKLPSGWRIVKFS